MLEVMLSGQPLRASRSSECANSAPSFYGSRVRLGFVQTYDERPHRQAVASFTERFELLEEWTMAVLPQRGHTQDAADVPTPVYAPPPLFCSALALRAKLKRCFAAGICSRARGAGPHDGLTHKPLELLCSGGTGARCQA